MGIRPGPLEAARKWLTAGGNVLVFGTKSARTSDAVDRITVASWLGRVLRCAAGPEDGHRPYHGLRRLLKPVAAADLARLSEACRDVLNAVLAGQTQTLSQAVVAKTVLTFIHELSRIDHVLLVVENLQWMDQVSVDAIEFVAARVHDWPVRLIATEWTARDNFPTRRRMCSSPLLLVRIDSDPSGPQTSHG